MRRVLSACGTAESDKLLDNCAHLRCSSGVPRNFVRGGGVQQIQLRTEDRENGHLGAVAS